MTAIVDIDAQKVVKALENFTDNLTKQLGIIAWKTSKKAKSAIAKQASSKVAVKQAEIKRKVKTKGLAKPQSWLTWKIQTSGLV